MSYGTSEYGQAAYGGSSLGTSSAYLYASTPAAGATGVAIDAPVQITIDAPSGGSTYTLRVAIAGQPIILGGEFRPGYSGSIVWTGTTLNIVVQSHPDFSGEVSIEVSFLDLAGESQVIPLTFTTVTSGVEVTDSVAISEGATTLQLHSAPVVTSVVLSEQASTLVAGEVAPSESLVGQEAATVMPGWALQDAVSLAEAVHTDQASTGAWGQDYLQSSDSVTTELLAAPSLSEVLEQVVVGSTGSQEFLGEALSQSSTVTATVGAGTQLVSETLTQSVTVSTRESASVSLSEPLAFSEQATGQQPFLVGVSETLILADRCLVGDGVASNIGGYLTVLALPQAVQMDRAADPHSYEFLTEGIAVAVLEAHPILSLVASGSAGQVLDPVGPRVGLDTTLTGLTVGDYLGVTEGPNQGIYRIAAVEQTSGPAIVVLDVPLTQDPATPFFGWELAEAPSEVLLTTSKQCNDTQYVVNSYGLQDKVWGGPADCTIAYTATAVPRPEVKAVSWSDNGSVEVQFAEPMLQDRALLNPGDYAITGATPVKVRRVQAMDPSRVRLETSGLTTGTYQLTVSTSTPRDLGGNPMSPTGNTLTFQAGDAVAIRSIYTDRGPIAKPPLVLQQGTNGLFETGQEVTLTGGTFDSTVIGHQLVIQGSGANDGSYEVLGLVSSSRLAVRASFLLPDGANGTWSWVVRDLRTGQIANDPSDVTVRINGTPVVPESVDGLLGQITLATVPAPSDTVQVDYYWVNNPTVPVQGFSHPAFRLNNWNRNGRTTNRATQHFYRYNNVLANPKKWHDAVQADLPQPLERDIRYRAYELEYSALLNRKSRLRYNTPRHRIAYPKASRTLSEVFIPYEGNVLPELDPANPWVRKGTGTASCVAGVLVCQDASDTQPVFWTRPLDLSYSHVAAMSWRGTVQASSQDGVWTGMAAGYSDPEFGVVLGYLVVAGERQVGFLLRGAMDPGEASAWSSVALDWTVTRTYRLYRGLTGAVSLYVDGSPEPLLTSQPDDLPYLADMPTPFEAVQGVWFGSLSRPAQAVSTWDFVRYQAIPTNATQYGYSGLVDYPGSVVPEQASKPWTPVGYAGTEMVLGSLLSTSNYSACAPTLGAMEGGFRAYTRLEPLLGTASKVHVETRLQGITSTFGPDPNGLTLVVNDGAKLLQASWVQAASAPKLSYGGKVLPEQFGTYGWVKNGTSTVRMAGHALVIDDLSTTDGTVYSCDDLAPEGSDARVLSSTKDYSLEAGLTVLSYQPDGAGFCGVTAQVFDGLKAVGFMLIHDGQPKVALSSDGAPQVSWAFNWADGLPHKYRIRKAHADPVDQVSLFCDDQLIGYLDYPAFPPVTTGLEGQLTFGSATPASMEARSEVEWQFCNAWRVNTPKQYWGLWNGGTSGTLLDFFLPGSRGKASLQGNALVDPLGQFTMSAQPGSLLLIPQGPNRGTYTVQTVVSDTTLTIDGTWPVLTQEVEYLIPSELDWTQPHVYQLDRTTSGEVTLTLDSTEVLRVPYGETLPNTQGVVGTISDGLPSITWGSLSYQDLGSSLWDYVRYQLTRSGSDTQPVPQLQVLNQWNLMHSGERLRTQIPHTLTSFRSSSTGMPPHKDPDLLANPDLRGNTVLNEGTPIVPLRQAIRDQLESLYTCIDQITVETGVTGLLHPFQDQATITGLQWTKGVALTYDGSALPENTPSGTPWELVSDNPGAVYRATSGTTLTYGTSGTTRTVYRNNTPLLDAVSLSSVVRFRVRVNQDATFGIGDSQIRLGFSAPEMTLGLAFQTHPTTMERFVNVLDMKSGLVVGACAFDYLDGQFHTYCLERDPTSRRVRIWIES